MNLEKLIIEMSKIALNKMDENKITFFVEDVPLIWGHRFQDSDFIWIVGDKGTNLFHTDYCRTHQSVSAYVGECKCLRGLFRIVGTKGDYSIKKFDKEGLNFFINGIIPY